MPFSIVPVLKSWYLWKKGYLNYVVIKKSGFASIYKRKLDRLNIKMENEEQIFLNTIDDFCFGKNISYINLLNLEVE